MSPDTTLAPMVGGARRTDAGPAVLLEARGVSYRVADKALLEGVSLRLRDGEVVAVLGPNGAGKSTLVRLLLGVEPPHGGEILLRGVPLTEATSAARRALVGLLQRSVLFSGTVAGNVGYGLRLRRVAAPRHAERVATALERMGVAHLSDRNVRSLSGGEAQRVAIARATVLDPDVLVLDEPGADLDVASRRRLLMDLESAVRGGRGGTILVTHDPDAAFALADRLYVLEGGRVVQAGTPADVVADPASPFVAELTGAELVVDGSLVSRRDALVEIELPGGPRWLAVPAADASAWATGAPMHVAYRPEDLILAEPDSTALSTPRNRVDATIVSVTPAGGLVRVRLDGPPSLVALVTREGAAELDLAPGNRVSARLKAVAARAYAAPSPPHGETPPEQGRSLPPRLGPR
ncbi:MAG: ABC transporter ATP-binding protein [Gemmatimonadota bacterium]